MGFNIEDFYKVISTTNFKTTLSNLVSTAGDYSYAGFKPQDLFNRLVSIKESAKMKDEDFATDIATILMILHARGPNVSNIKAANTMGSTNTMDIITRVIKTYNLKAKAGQNPLANTLPRISLTFPYFSMTIWNELNAKKQLNTPVSEQEIGISGSLFCSPGFIPSLLSSVENGKQGVVFFVHCLYQTLLSYKTEKVPKGGSKKSKDEHFCLATKYSSISLQNTFATEEQVNVVSLELETSAASITTDLLLIAIKKVFNTGFIFLSETTPTKYHYMLNYYALKAKDINTMTVEQLNLSLDEMRRSYPL